MKAKAVILLIVALTACAFGRQGEQLIINPDFSLNAQGQIDLNPRSLDDTLGWSGTGWSDVRMPTSEGAPLPAKGMDLAGRVSYNGYYSEQHHIHQDTGHFFQEDSVYVLSFDTFALNSTDRFALEWYADGEYIGWSREYFWITSPSVEWQSWTVSFDTADSPEVAGKELGIRLLHFERGGRTLVSNFKLMALTDVLHVRDDILTLDQLTEMTVHVDGRSELRLNSADLPMDGESSVHLGCESSWLIFTRVSPSHITQSLLDNVYVQGVPAEKGKNVHVVQYGLGSVVIPHSPNLRPLTAYSERGFAGKSGNFGRHTYYRSELLGPLNNSIRSFRLKRGYMATFAQEPDGTGISKVYIANDRDIEVHQMPHGLDQSVSFIRVFPWRWPTKKGWSGGPDQGQRVDACWWYDWDNNKDSTNEMEYVPMRHNRWWPSWSNINENRTSTHVLGFNEPEREDQADMTVAQAIELWPRLMESGLRLGSPAPSDAHYALEWLYEFIDEADARDYRVDFVAVHFYKNNWSGDQIYNWLRGIHERTGRPLWVTEWNNGCNWTQPHPSEEHNAAKIYELSQAMNRADFVERYSIYQWCTNRELISYHDGSLTLSGDVYRQIEAPLANTHGKNQPGIIDVIRHPRAQTANYGGQALFEVDVAEHHKRGMSYHWYRSDDTVIDHNVDTMVGQGDAIVIEDITIDDEGLYYCRLIDNWGNVVHTKMAQLSLRGQKHRWKLDDQANWEWNEDYSRTYIEDSADAGTVSYIQTGNRETNRDAVLFGQPPAPSGTESSIEFAGPREYVALGPVAPQSGEFTIMFWFKLHTFRSRPVLNTIMSSDTGQLGGWSIHLWGDEDFLDHNDGRPRLDFYHEGYGNITLLGAVDQQQWYHVKLTRNSENSFKIYVNNDLVHEGYNSLGFANAQDKGLWLAMQPTGEGPFQGWLDDVRIFNYAVDGNPDLTRSGIVDVADLAILVRCWLSADCATCDIADLNLDGRIDFRDFAIFAQAWLNQ